MFRPIDCKTPKQLETRLECLKKIMVDATPEGRALLREKIAELEARVRRGTVT
jgi:hypothetical protein